MDKVQREKDVLRKLVRARDAIRRKYQLLKFNKSNAEQVLSETFKPIVDPLQKIATNIEKKALHPPLKASIFSPPPRIQSTPKKKDIIQVPFTKLDGGISDLKFPSHSPFKLNKSVHKSTKFDNDLLHFDKSIDENIHRVDQEKPKEEEDDIKENYETADEDETLQDEYIQMLKKKDTSLDKIYGVREENGEYVIGNSKISFTQDHIVVNQVKYPRTVGLTELILLKLPSKKMISEADENNYKQILLSSGALLRKSDGLLMTKKTNKYIEYIAPMFSTKKGGSLPEFKIAKRNTFTDYKYWDDPNELVDRLELLVAERSAGNPSHNNEILAIIEELREGGYIY